MPMCCELWFRFCDGFSLDIARKVGDALDLALIQSTRSMFFEVGLYDVPSGISQVKIQPWGLVSSCHPFWGPSWWTSVCKLKYCAVCWKYVLAERVLHKDIRMEMRMSWWLRKWVLPQAGNRARKTVRRAQWRNIVLEYRSVTFEFHKIEEHPAACELNRWQHCLDFSYLRSCNSYRFIASCLNLQVFLIWKL